MKLAFLIALLTTTVLTSAGEPAKLPSCSDQAKCLYVLYGPAGSDPPTEICLVADFERDVIPNDECKKGGEDDDDCISWACSPQSGQEEDFCDTHQRCEPIDCESGDQIAFFYIKDSNSGEEGCGNPGDMYNIFEKFADVPGTTSISATCQDADGVPPDHPDFCDPTNPDNPAVPVIPDPNACDDIGSCDKSCVWMIDYSHICDCEDMCETLMDGGVRIFTGDPLNYMSQIQTDGANNNGEISHNNAFKTNNNTAVGDISVNHLVIIIFCIFIVSAVIAGFVYYYVRVIKNRKFMKKVCSNVIVNDEAEVAEQQNQTHMECESITNTPLTPTSQNDNTNDNTDS